MKTILTIAGSDSSGGAGIQADIKTITMHGMYAMSAITAMTAQNTLGVSAVWEATEEQIREQILRIVEDIPPDAVKVGMVCGQEQIQAIGEQMRRWNMKNVVVDTVMASTSGTRFLKEQARDALKKELLPFARLVTPNLPEAELLSGMKIRSEEEMERAARKMSEAFETAILVKGGHLEGAAADVLAEEGKETWFTTTRLENSNTHGTGCTLSSAIACRLAAGEELKTAVAHAKVYVTEAIRAGLNLGKGNGPLQHIWRFSEEELLEWAGEEPNRGKKTDRG